MRQHVTPAATNPCSTAGQAAGRDRGEQTAAGLRVVGQRDQRPLDAGCDCQGGRHEPAVVPSAVRLKARRRERQGA